MGSTNNTSLVILGMLRIGGELSGYEIKALVDDSTEFFWPASYGRIYPELRRLEEEGLIASRDEPRGQRPRRVYVLTDDGEAALDEWLGSPSELAFEFRDEGLLRFFFSDFASKDEALANLRAMKARHESIVARMRELEPFVSEAEPLRFPLRTLRFGIELHSAYAAWCERAAAELEDERD